jgi:hypothetical protein
MININMLGPLTNILSRVCVSESLKSAYQKGNFRVYYDLYMKLF